MVKQKMLLLDTARFARIRYRAQPTSAIWPDIMASLGLVQLDHYPEVATTSCKGISWIAMIVVAGTRIHPLALKDYYSWSSRHLYITLVKILSLEKIASQIIQELTKAEIASSIRHQTTSLLTAYKNLSFRYGGYPKTYTSLKMKLHYRFTRSGWSRLYHWDFVRVSEEVLASSKD